MDTQKIVDATEAIITAADQEIAKLKAELSQLKKPDVPAKDGHV